MGDTILIVDDDLDILHILRYALESCGHSVFLCENAIEAQQRIMTDSCNYIITDYELPGMNGIELTRYLRTHAPASIIIGMSGRDMNMAFLRAGANDFIKKPFIPYDLVMMIDGGDLAL